MRKLEHFAGLALALALCTPLRSHAQTITGYRYWFDDNASAPITITVSGGPVFTLNTTVDASLLGIGYHQATFQFHDSDGRWGVPTTKMFVKTGADLTAWQYWFDDDVSTLQTMDVTAVPTMNVSTLIDAATIGWGGHTITLRAKDAIGNWSVPLTQAFDVTVGITEIPGLESVVLMPNPADDQLQLRFNARADLDLSYDVIDATGRSVRDAERASVSGSTFRTVDVSMFAPGFYQLRLIGTNGVKRIPFIKR